MYFIISSVSLQTGLLPFQSISLITIIEGNRSLVSRVHRKAMEVIAHSRNLGKIIEIHLEAIICDFGSHFLHLGNVFLLIKSCRLIGCFDFFIIFRVLDAREIPQVL